MIERAAASGVGHRRRRSKVAPAGAPMPGAYASVTLPPGSVKRGPVQLGDQGVSKAERPHAEGAIKRLFEAPGVDMVAMYDQATGQYELRSRTGFVRWERWATPTGELRYVEVARGGVDPVPSMDGTILQTLGEEAAAAGGVGKPVPKERNSYPDIYERLSQLWDHTRAPDFVFIPTPGGDPNHPGAGSHGIPDVVQSRAPLVIAGPGIAQGAVSNALVRHTDVAPTVADLLGVQPVLGSNASGVSRLQLLRWQDGSSLTAGSGALASGAEGAARLRGSAERAIVIAVDGMSQTAMLDEMARGNLPNIAKLVARGTTFRNGTIAEYPTVTWSNHNTLVTGASPGHNGIVNNSWFDRERQTEQLITDGGARNSLQTAKLIDPAVETLYEAVERSFPGALTMAINQPSGRGADVSVLDLVGVPSLLANLPKVLGGIVSGWLGRDKAMDAVSSWKITGLQDIAGAAIGQAYWAKGTPPKLGVFEFTQVDNRGHIDGPHHERARRALREVDKEIGRLLATLEEKGLTKSTAIVLTADHGMEHQDTDEAKLGGWFDALERAKDDGVKVKESTRFVYVKSVRFAVEGAAPAAGTAGVLKLKVSNDDQDVKGERPGVQHARVTVFDADGTRWTGVTAPDGTVSLPMTPKRGPLRLVIEHNDFSRETGVIPLDSSRPGVDAAVEPSKRRRREGAAHH